MQRFLRRYWLAVAILVAFIALWAGLWSNRYTRVGLTTAFLLPDLFVDAPVSPLKLVGDDPIREEVTFPSSVGPVVADIYRPRDDDPHGAFVVAVGAAPRIRQHPAAIRLSKAAARAGMVAMIPDLEHLLRDEMVPQEIDKLVAAFDYLRHQPFVDPQRTGFLGFSLGAGLALVAASEPRIRDDVRFFMAFGSYYDLFDMITAAATRTITDNGQRQPWQPDIKTVRVLQRSLIYYADSPQDRHILTRIFLEEDPAATEDIALLSPRSRLIFDILDNRSPDRMEELFARLSPQDRDTLRRLSPSASIDGLHTQLFIAHDRGDPYIPYIESRRLRDAALRNSLDLHYVEFDIFDHVEPASPGDPITFLANLIKLLFYAYLLLLRVA